MYCCPAFEKHIEQFEKYGDGAWNVNGCCGGCYVLQGIRFCPFCGRPLQNTTVIDGTVKPETGATSIELV